MTQLIAVDADALEALRAEVAEVRRMLSGAVVTPAPEWIPLNDYAKKVGRNRKTIIRWIETGRVQAKHIDGVRMVRITQAA